MAEAHDTEILLALLASLVSEPALSQDVLLDALAEADGDVQRAAAAINQASGTKSSQKRLRTADISGWLKPAPPKSRRLSTEPSGATSRGAREDTAPVTSPGSAQSSTPKHKRSLAEVLRAPSPAGPSVPKLAPLTLSNPSMVAKHTSCTLHLNVLPPDLACSLFYAMMDEAADWTRNKWFLFDRLVESPHRTSFYTRQQASGDDGQGWLAAAQHWYNGRRMPTPQQFLPEMEKACEVVEKVVNEEMAKRPRFALEWDGDGTGGQNWRANVAAANCYAGSQESVGFHSDQLTNIGPYATIASLSLGTRRVFRLREVVPKDESAKRQAQTFNIPLPHNSLIIMHAGTQEYFKHCVPPQPTIDLFRPSFPRQPDQEIEPSNCRINMTFRFYRPDFASHSIPRCMCGVPTILRPDMKGRPESGKEREREMKYWWTCYAGAQNDGQSCNFWKVMDVHTEGRGPLVGTTSSQHGLGSQSS